MLTWSFCMVSALLNRRTIRPGVSTTTRRNKRARTAVAAVPSVLLRSTALCSSNGHAPASRLAHSALAPPPVHSDSAFPFILRPDSTPRASRGGVDGGSSFLRLERPEATSAGAGKAGRWLSSR